MSCKRGYTLIELVIAVTLIGLLSIGFFSLIFNTTDIWTILKIRDSAMADGRFALSKMLLELRRVESLTTILTNECQFVDVDDDTVNFKQTGTGLYRNSVLFVSNIATTDGLSFSYLNSSGTATSVTTEVRNIRAKISIVKNGETVTLQSSAKMRNL